MKVLQQTTKVTYGFPGQVQGIDEIQIRSKINGAVVEKYIQGGDRVHAGQAPFKIDSHPYETALLSAKADLNKAESNFRRAQDTLNRSENEYLKVISKAMSEHAQNPSNPSYIMTIILSNNEEYPFKGVPVEADRALSQNNGSINVSSPICNFELNREKAKQLGVSFSDVYTTLQANFGGSQIGDFMQFGRNYKIMLQSDAQYRNEAEALKFSYVRNKNGTMVPLKTLLHSKYGTSPANSREEKKSAGSTMRALALALIFVFLCLATLYESWSVPFAVLLTIPTGIFGAFFIQCTLFMGLAALGSPNPDLMNTLCYII